MVGPVLFDRDPFFPEKDVAESVRLSYHGDGEVGAPLEGGIGMFTIALS